MRLSKSNWWTLAAIVAALIILFSVTGIPGLPGPDKTRPKPGEVYELTAANLPGARRHAPVLVALFTEAGNVHGARMARGLPSLAERTKGRAIIAVGNLDNDPALASRASLKELPAWVVYRDGTEVARATGEFADLSVDRFIAEQTGTAP